MRLLLYLLLALTLSGCQSMGAAFSNAVSSTVDWVTGGDENADPPRELQAIEPEIKILTLWEEDVGQGDGGNSLSLTLASDGDRVYAADHKGELIALKVKTGERVWKAQLKLPLSAGPALGDETILLGTSEAQVLALAKESGKILWTAHVSSEVLAPPQAAQGVVIVHTSDGAVFALSETEGRVLWSLGQHLTPLSLRGISPPKILLRSLSGTEDMVLVGFANGRMAAFRLSDGKLIWEKPLAVASGMSELEQIVDIDSAPQVDDRMVYVTAFYGGVIAASLLDGEVIWRNDRIIAQATPAVTWRHLFVTDVAGDVWCLDETTGRAYWKQTDLHRRELTAPVPYGDWLVVGDYQGYVHFLAQEDGRLVGRKRVSRSPIVAAPVVVGDVLLVLSRDGGLTALKVEH